MNELNTQDHHMARGTVNDASCTSSAAVTCQFEPCRRDTCVWSQRLTDVNNGIRSQHRPDDGDLIEQAHCPEVAPATIVLEIQEYLPASVQGPAHAPQYANKDNEAHSMPYQTNHL